MQCLHCSYMNKVTADLCEACGASLEIECSTCGGLNRPTSRFCGRCGSDLGHEQAAPTAPSAIIDPMIGRIIDGRYRVLARIGQGGMGAVYKVEHLAMGKLAAMKALHPSLTKRPPSPRGQNPASSSCWRTSKVKQS